MKKVVLLGAESSGTTTLAQRLASFYDTVWVPEYGRMYSDAIRFRKRWDWTISDFVTIAEQQNKLEEMFTPLAKEILICDTDAWTTVTWCERYIGKGNELETMIPTERPDLYILTGIDIPFVQDGTRTKYMRKEMHDMFLWRLAHGNTRFIQATGTIQERELQAIEAIAWL